MPHDYVDFRQAQLLARRHLPLLPPRVLPLAQLAGLVMAQAAQAQVASPSVTACTKDGYAVRSADVQDATPQGPVVLRLVGTGQAGEPAGPRVGPGQAVRVTTGAALPPGAQAVLAREFARQEDERVLCLADAPPGKNVYPAGSDVAPGQVVVQAGQVVTPSLAGLLAAAGCHEAPAHPRPRVGLLATGREVVAPGQPLPPGAVYASNLVSLAAWLSLHGLEHQTLVVDDQAQHIAQAAQEMLAGCDALLTSGGAWLSERDLVVGTLKDLGMELIFRRVRMGPGKGVALGILDGKPVFCLPGGPPSNEMAFLQLALPGLLAMAGHPDPGLPQRPARLAAGLTGDRDWTQFFHGRLEPGDPLPLFHPLPLAGRLKAMAGSQAIARLDQGNERLPAGAVLQVQALAPAWARTWP
ncbi:MAG: molybdopterin molybdotransferase MoeA [Desulfarculus sp.]|nr:molybdopterin molybdotransferase MoeA [Desulfarculus sp.]